MIIKILALGRARASGLLTSRAGARLHARVREWPPHFARERAITRARARVASPLRARGQYPLLILLLVSSVTFSQTDTLFRVDSVAYFTVDALERVLTVQTNGELRQYSPTGQLLFVYHNTTLGEHFTIDATDPFNILLFYQEQQTIVLLDRTLSEWAVLDLRETPLTYVTAIARSHDNNIWCFDELEGRLYRINPQGQLLFTGNDLRLSEGLTTGPTQILRWNDKVIMIVPERGLAVFNILGRLQEWWPILNINDIFIQENALFFKSSERNYHRYIPQSLETLAINGTEFPADLTQWRTSANTSYLLTNAAVLTVRKKHLSKTRN